MTVQHQVNQLWSRGFNPIHLFKNVYLVRHESTQHSKWPIYFIRVLKE